MVAANRGPVSFHSDPSGDPVITRGPGGLVTVLTELLRKYPGTWVATALGEEEERLAGGAVDVELDGDAYRVRYVAVDRDVYHKYYNIIANPMLWFIQHYLWDLGRHPDISPNEVDAWWNGYVPVQRLFAAAVSDDRRRYIRLTARPRAGQRHRRRPQRSGGREVCRGGDDSLLVAERRRRAPYEARRG